MFGNKKLITFFIFLLLTFFVSRSCFADDLDSQLASITNQISALTQALSESQKATKPLEENVVALQNQIQSIENQLNSLEVAIVEKAKDIKKGESDLVNQKKNLDGRARSYYKQSQSYLNNVLAIFLSKNLSEATRQFFIQQQGVYKNRDYILQTALFVRTLEEKKASLQEEEATLAKAKADLDKQKSYFDTEVAKAKTYQASLQSQIAELSAKQQEIIAQKQASLNIPHSASSGGRCDSDLTNGRDPGFSPKFAFFTYGVPNRVGLNQYGAWGRARSGKSVEDILAFYYPGLTLKKDYDTGATINVDGYGSYNVEDYVKRIYEMPDSWTENDLAALKAQAVAARSYGLAHRSGICTTESCQVFKAEEKGGNWGAAVSATAGWVLVDGSGNPVSTQYSSTHGGYVLSTGQFDGEGGVSSFNDLNNNAYDKESPWFYCDWGSRSEYNKTAWLKPEELADIVNVIQLAKYSDIDKNHFYQTDISNPVGVETWSAERVKTELRNKGGTPINTVNGASVGADFSSGRSATVHISGDTASLNIAASEFKDWFNLRAPANVQIVGPLFNVEKR